MNTSRKTIWLWLAVLLLIMGFIFYQSSLPATLSNRESNVLVQWLLQLVGGDRHTVTLLVRKGAHFSEYMALGLCLALAAGSFCGRKERRWRRPTPGMLLLSWAVGAGYAVTDELHQIFTPGRSCELRDVCIDSAGVLCGVLVVWILSRNVHKNC